MEYNFYTTQQFNYHWVPVESIHAYFTVPPSVALCTVVTGGQVISGVQKTSGTEAISHEGTLARQTGDASRGVPKVALLAPLAPIAYSVSRAVQTRTRGHVTVQSSVVAVALYAGVSDACRGSGVAPGAEFAGGALVGGGAAAVLHRVG